MKFLAFVFIVAIFASCSTKYFIVRHAEKETAATNMSTDVALSVPGKERAEALKNILRDKKIRAIFSTNTLRTMSTAEPLSKMIGISIQEYDARDTSFVTRVKALNKGNVLIVGHSNTVDEIINGFLDKMQLQDLPDSKYGDLFIIKKRGNNYKLATSYFGK